MSLENDLKNYLKCSENEYNLLEQMLCAININAKEHFQCIEKAREIFADFPLLVQVLNYLASDVNANVYEIDNVLVQEMYEALPVFTGLPSQLRKNGELTLPIVTALSPASD